jgi:hypothetical protein
MVTVRVMVRKVQSMINTDENLKTQLKKLYDRQRELEFMEGRDFWMTKQAREQITGKLIEFIDTHGVDTVTELRKRLQEAYNDYY